MLQVLMGPNELEVDGLIAATGKEIRPILEVWDRSEIVPLVDYRRAVISVAK